MSDIFISYASEDRGRVQSLARALERVGWSVWWDRRIPTGRPFDEVIQEELDISKAVVVVWTTKSVKSHWVKNEARRGLNNGKMLFPLMLLEEVEIPFGFEHLQAAQLMDWQPQEAHSGFDHFVQDIAQVLGPPPGPGFPQPPVKPLKKRPPSQAKPESGIESPSGRAGQVKQDGELQEQKPPTLEAISVALDPPGKSLSPLAGTQSQEPAQIHIPEGEGRVSGATVGTTPAQCQPQSQRYILIGIGLFLVMGAFVAYWILSLGSSPVKTGKDGAPMVLIPAGEFQMGSPDGEGNDNERPRHRVSLDAYSMDKFEVTVPRYAKFLQSTGLRDPDYWDQVNTSKHSNLPVVGVDWHDAEAYCQWAGKRLPTEAEWERAARGTDGRTYPWGNGKPTPELANFNKEYVMKNVYDERLAPVDSHEAGNSPYGLHHMAGNAWEWTADRYHGQYYKNSPPKSPKGPSTGEARVLRGGSWLNPPDLVRSANRAGYTPTDRLSDLGFRCAQDRPK